MPTERPNGLRGSSKGLHYIKKKKIKVSEREKILRLLEDGDFARLVAQEGNGHSVFRTLISLSYDKESVISWRAIEAIGLIAGVRTKSEPGLVRGIVQRILWMMREESGNNPWSAPEMLGEIVRNAPEEFADIAPIIASFHDEEILRRGVLRALARISEVRADIVEDSSAVAGEYLGHSDALTRAYALEIVRNLMLKEFLADVYELERDHSVVRIYSDGDFESFTVGKIAAETVILLTSEENDGRNC